MSTRHRRLTTRRIAKIRNEILMGLYKCAKCGCCENTATGFYWTREMVDMYDWSDVGDEFKGKPLCSECAPTHFSSGQKTRFGKWHNHFKKEPYDEVMKRYKQ